MANVKIHPCAEVSTIECGIRSSHSRPSRSPGCGGFDREVRPVASAVASLSSGSPKNFVPGSRAKSDCAGHDQNAGGCCAATSPVRTGPRDNHWGCGLTGRSSPLGSGQSSWLSVKLATTSTSTISLIGCLRRSLSRSMTSWYRTALGGPAHHIR